MRAPHVEEQRFKFESSVGVALRPAGRDRIVRYQSSQMSVRPGKRCPHQWQLCKWPTSLLVHTHGLPEKKQLQQSARLVYSRCNIHLVQCKYAISWHAALTNKTPPTLRTTACAAALNQYQQKQQYRGLAGEITTAALRWITPHCVLSLLIR